MSAATIHTTTQPATRPTLPGQRTAPPRLRLVPDPAPVTTVFEPGDDGLQLTRRGRLVLMLALVAAGAVLAFMISGLVGGVSPGSVPAQPQTRTLVVQPGQTLWSIARDIAPGADRRDTIARIVQLNALPSTDVAAGTRLAVPTR
jgi:hypothetical protein